MLSSLQNDTNTEEEEQINEKEEEIAKIVTALDNTSLGVLKWIQVKKLDCLLEKFVPIHGRGNYPTLNVQLKDFIRNLNRRLVAQRIRVKNVRINGGVASYVLAEDNNYEFSDIDIIFTCDLLQLNDSEQQTPTNLCNLDTSFSNICDIIKQTVFDCLLSYISTLQNCKEKISSQNIKDAYVKKMVKIYQSTSSNVHDTTLKNADESIESQQSSSRWSLISLCNDQGQNIELKFVDKMKRQFQFSVDAFQIHLNSLLSYYDCQDSLTDHNNVDNKMTENIYPTVIAESMYGEFGEANHHLNAKLIATKSPEEIRGGGLLKYCNLLIKGYKPICVQTQMHSMEKYMCSRFFIDFSDLNEQEHKLNAYLDCHFQNSPKMCVSYLEKLFEVVDSSTVCLMGHERKQTLNLIKALAQDFQRQQQRLNEEIDELNEANDILQQQQHHNYNNNAEYYDLHGTNESHQNNVRYTRSYLNSHNGHSSKNMISSSPSSNFYYEQTRSHYHNTNNKNNNNHHLKQQHQQQSHINYLNQQFQQNHYNKSFNYQQKHTKPTRFIQIKENSVVVEQNQKYENIKIVEQQQQNISSSTSPSLSLSSSPLPSNLACSLEEKPKTQTESNLFSSSISSLGTSSVASSVISSPSRSPSPTQVPFYITLNAPENTSYIETPEIDSKMQESKKSTDDTKQAHNNNNNKVFQCKIPSQSYPYIEVFYNCYSPPVLPPPQINQGEQPMIVLYQNQSHIQQHQPISSKSSSTSSSPIYFYYSNTNLNNNHVYSTSPSETTYQPFLKTEIVIQS